MRRPLRLGSPLAGLVVAVTVYCTVFFAWRAGRLMPLELALHDLFVRSAASAEAPARVVLVRIEEGDIGRFGHPLADETLARALEALLACEPRAVGVDLYRDQPAGTGRAELARVVSGDPRVVLIEKVADASGPGVPPPDFADGAGRIGFADTAPDDDGVVRRGLLFLWDAEDRAHLSFPLQLALRHLAPEGLGLGPDAEDPDAIRLGAARIPPLERNDGGYVDSDAGGFQLLLDFPRGAVPFPSVTLGALLDGRFDREAIRGRSVILGTTAPSVKDDFETPYSAALLGQRSVSGIELHAQVLEQLLGLAQGARIATRFAPEWAEALWLAVACALGAAAGLGLRSAGALTLGTAACALVPLGTTFVAHRLGWWIPGAGPSLAGLGAAAAAVAWNLQRSRAERAAVMQLFGRFVSRRIADRIWEQRAEFLEHGRPKPQRLVATVLLADLAGYTSVAEKLEPEALVAWLNEFMAAAASAIEQHGGIVDDYAGDGIKANFGVPVARAREEDISSDAAEAVRCALAMGRDFTALNARWRAAGRPESRLRIGIATGPVVIGSIGSAERLKYTTLGDTVNVAARLESFDKDREDEAPFRILVSAETRRRLPADLAVRALGVHGVHNRREPIAIYRVLDGPEAEPAREGGAT